MFPSLAAAATAGKAFSDASDAVAGEVKPLLNQMAELRKQKKQYDELDTLLEENPKTLAKPVMVPLGAQAFVPGELYRTNEVLVGAPEGTLVGSCEGATLGGLLGAPLGASLGSAEGG